MRSRAKTCPGAPKKAECKHGAGTMRTHVAGAVRILRAKSACKLLLDGTDAPSNYMQRRLVRLMDLDDVADNLADVHLGNKDA